VPIFAVIIEIIGWRTGESRYDWLSHELVKLTFAAFSTTALLGALLLFLFVGYYPKFWTYMTSIFFPTYWVYALLFFAETFTVYLWYYGWNWLSGPRKGIHVGLGVLSNLVMLVLTLVVMLGVSWQITVLALLLLPVFVVPARRMGARLARLEREARAWAAHEAAERRQRAEENLAASEQLRARLEQKGSVFPEDY